MGPEFLKEISDAFSGRIGKYRDTPAGVLWKNAAGQSLRFELLAGILDDAPGTGTVTVNDLGCGYGALLDFLKSLPQMPRFDYAGYDISGKMVKTARQRTRYPHADFHVADKANRRAGYAFVSGTYNLKLGVDDGLWRDFVRESIADLWSKTDTAMAFNMLDARADYKEEGLYYADADEFVEFARTLSGNVTLIDDYPLEEWTIYLLR